MNIEVRQALHPDHARTLGTGGLRENYVADPVFVPGEARLYYSHYDRMLFGGICPNGNDIALEPSSVLGTKYFLERRELGMINLGGAAVVSVDGTEYRLANRGALYVGMGSEGVSARAADPKEPPKLYLASTTAHSAHPTTRVTFEEANPVHLGSREQSNTRTIYQYVHPKVLSSCQLAMGMTVLEPENVWNTMPCHTHDRRMEVYLYFDLSEDDVVFHLMGPPGETRHLVLRNEQAVISPNWSIHSGVGTSNYTFIWAMAGENQEFTDMDAVPMAALA